jgi:hypothetical protein
MYTVFKAKIVRHIFKGGVGDGVMSQTAKREGVVVNCTALI